MSKIIILSVTLFFTFNSVGSAKNFMSNLLPNLSFELPEQFQKNDSLVDYEMKRLQKVAPEIYALNNKIGTKFEAYADPGFGDERQNNIFISARKLKDQEYYEVKTNEVAQNVCKMLTAAVKQIYNSKKDLMTYKCYKMKFPANAKWGLYQELDHPDFDGRSIYMLYIDQNLNEVSVSVQCEFKNCNRLRLHMANMIKSLKYN